MNKLINDGPTLSDARRPLLIFHGGKQLLQLKMVPEKGTDTYIYVN